MRGGAIGLAAIALAAAGSVAAREQQTHWRAIASADDRDRVREWRDTWLDAVAAARQGTGAAALAADPALFDADGALDAPLPPAGAYRCRMTKFAGPRLVVDAWQPCRIAAAGALLRLERPGPLQRFTGALYADATTRGVFLGVMTYADERGTIAYGHAAGRDMAGLVQRIGARRWRLVLPLPRFETQLDVLDLVPAG